MGESILDDQATPALLPLRRGTLAFAGSGTDSRTTQLWIALQDDVAGKQPWETPVGYVQEGLQVLDDISTEYGDLAVFNGNAPDPVLMEKEDGLDYLLKGWPNIDYFESCSKLGLAREESLGAPKFEEVFVGTVKAGEQLTQRTKTGHIFVAKPNGSDQVLKRVFVKNSREFVQLSSVVSEL